MRSILFLIFTAIFFSVEAQEIKEKEVIATTEEVTVFLEGAQLTDRKTVELSKGISVLKFTKLSPFIDAKSIQVKAHGNVTVLSVNHQHNYLKTLDKSSELQKLENKQLELEEKIKLENTYVDIIKEQIAFLQQNRGITGKNEATTVANLKATADYYAEKLTSLKLQEIEHQKKINNLNVDKQNIDNQIRSITSEKEYPVGEILVKIDSKTNSPVLFELMYLTANAGWYPTYDIRAKNINEPIQIIYKANVRQDTKNDWKNVKLTFSSANPNVSGMAPEMQPYFLDYYSRPPVYRLAANIVNGKITASNGEPLPGANIIVDGTTIGTISDFDGNYSITIPNSSSTLSFSFIGYDTKKLAVTGTTMNVALEESQMMLDEVVVVGYGADKPRNFASSVMSVKKEQPKILIRGTSSTSIPVKAVEKQTVVDFEIKTPYTIKTDNKSFAIDMVVYDLPANYQYYCVPKIDRDAFLLANITEWEKYNLLEGEANIFFEDTYIGKTILDTRSATDTLQISLGRDKSVSVNREKIKDYTTRRFIGTKKEEFRAWKIVVKNNKTQAINMILLDQIPVARLEEIEINVESISNANHNKQTGEVKWQLTIEPNTKAECEMKYSVKYPKHRTLTLE